MTTIVATPGAANANSFATEVEFIAYASARLNVPTGTTVSGSACTETEKKALVEATRELTLLMYAGIRPSSTQALSWPRGYAPNPDLDQLEPGGSLTDVYFADDVIPQRVKDATVELALAFIKAGTSDIAGPDTTVGVIEKTVGPLTTRWSESRPRPHGLARYPRVAALITPLLSTSAGVAELARQ
jgi:hypothetical protein